MGNKSSQRQFLVRVDGLLGFFARKSGGNVSAEVTKSYDGGSLVPDLVSAPPNTDNITVGRTYDPDRDAADLARLRPLVGSLRTTVSVTPTDADLVAIAPPTTYSDALLVGLNEVEVDAGSGELAEYELEFAVAQVR